jgi:hypothetical protein
MSQHHVSTIASFFVSVSVIVYMAMTMSGFMTLNDPVVEAKVSLTFTAVLIVNVFVIAFLYAKHFAQNVSDPLYVMKRGMSETSITSREGQETVLRRGSLPARREVQYRVCFR